MTQNLQGGKPWKGKGKCGVDVFSSGANRGFEIGGGEKTKEGGERERETEKGSFSFQSQKKEKKRGKGRAFCPGKSAEKGEERKGAASGYSTHRRSEKKRGKEKGGKKRRVSYKILSSLLTEAKGRGERKRKKKKHAINR